MKMKVIDSQPSKPDPVRLVGGVIVTHGHLASEFIAAAEMIVGPIPHVTPASIDWHDDIDVARQDDERTWRDFAGCDDALACRIGFAFTEPCQPIDLRRLQHGKHLIASGFDE